jgi:hypothetical protein
VRSREGRDGLVDALILFAVQRSKINLEASGSILAGNDVCAAGLVSRTHVLQFLPC